MSEKPPSRFDIIMHVSSGESIAAKLEEDPVLKTFSVYTSDGETMVVKPFTLGESLGEFKFQPTTSTDISGEDAFVITVLDVFNFQAVFDKYLVEYHSVSMKNNGTF